jgi:hypothetical protein
MSNEAAAISALDKGVKSGAISGGAFMRAFSRVAKGEDVSNVFKDTYKLNETALTKYLSKNQWELGFPLLTAELNEKATNLFESHGYDVQFTGLPGVVGHVAQEHSMVFKCEIINLSNNNVVETFEWDVGEAPFLIRVCADQHVPDCVFSAFLYDNTVLLRNHVPNAVAEDVADMENRYDAEFWKVTDENMVRASAGYGPAPVPQE